jgi:uncharacterized protein YndB with AHSA1/START domain
MSSSKSYEHRGRTIRAEIRTSAAPLAAWEAWADAEKIAGWFVDRATGEGKAGGIMTWFFDDFGYQLPYQVVASVPGELFVLKWQPPQGDPGILEVTLSREGGETLVRLVNSGFREGAQWDEEYEGVNSGWRTALAVLKHYLENYFGRARKTLLIVRPASFEYAQLRGYFHEEAKLAEWLVTSGSVGDTGEACQLALRGGGSLTGRVLATTKSEAALSWREFGGTLELKAFSMGPHRMAGVRAMSWTSDAPGLARTKAQLQAAVERLATIFPAAAAAGATRGTKSSPFKDQP